MKTHSELIANIKRLTVLVKSHDSTHALLHAAAGGDDLALLAHADHKEEMGDKAGADHSRRAYQWLQSQPKKTSHHYTAATEYARDPEKYKHPEVQFEARKARRIADRIPGAGHNTMKLEDQLAAQSDRFQRVLYKYGHPLSNYIEEADIDSEDFDEDMEARTLSAARHLAGGDTQKFSRHDHVSINTPNGRIRGYVSGEPANDKGELEVVHSHLDPSHPAPAPDGRLHSAHYTAHPNDITNHATDWLQNQQRGS